MSYEVLKLSDVYASSTNPRKEFEEHSLNELAESIKEHGLIQPVLVREQPDRVGKYEIVCGERRWRASKIAKLETIPAIIKDVSDDEAFELQIIENLERKDVHPMDEAEAFQKMLDSGRYTIADIAAKVAKTESFVTQRLKLNDLIDEIKKDFYVGELGVGHAVLLAKITEDRQKEIFEDYKDSYVDGYGTIGELKNEIEKETYNLDDAIFPLMDSQLVPKAGACFKCPKNSKANPVLFPDEKEENLCFDKSCYREKEETFYYNKIENLIKESPGIILIGNYYGSKGKIIESLLKENNKEVLRGYDMFEKTEEGISAFHVDDLKFVNITLKKGAEGKNISSDPTENIKSEIKKVKEKAERALELDREKIYTRIIDEVIKGENKLLNNDPLTGDEITAFVYALWEKGSYEFRKWFKEEYKLESSLDSLQMLDFIDEQIDTEGVYKIFRAYIIHNLVVGYSLDYKKSGNAAAVYSMVKFHHEKQVELFELEQNEIADKRIEKTNTKIQDLESSITASEVGPDVEATAKQFDLENEYHNTEENEIRTSNKNIKGDASSLAKLLSGNKELPTFEKITRKKKFSLNKSYFKNCYPQTEPNTPLECMYYFKQHGELPFDMGSDTENWLYECFVEYQKRAGVYGSQFFTPPATAKRMAELADEYFKIEERDEPYVLDACCGFGMLSKPLLEKGFIVNGFDINKELLELYNDYTGCISEQKDINSYMSYDKWKYIISNPPYEIKECTQFLKLLWDLLAEDGTAILLLPKNFIDKDKPKALVEVLGLFEIIYREDMQEDFARTGVKAEIVVLRKA